MVVGTAGALIVFAIGSFLIGVTLVHVYDLNQLGEAANGVIFVLLMFFVVLGFIFPIVILRRRRRGASRPAHVEIGQAVPPEILAKPAQSIASQAGEAKPKRRVWPELIYIAQSTRIHGASSQILLTGKEPKDDEEKEALALLRQVLYGAAGGALAVICGWLLYFIINSGPRAWLAALFITLVVGTADWLRRNLPKFWREARAESTGTTGEADKAGPTQTPVPASPSRLSSIVMIGGILFPVAVTLTGDFLLEFWRPVFLSVATLTLIGAILLYILACESRTIGILRSAPDVPHDTVSRIVWRVGSLGGGIWRSMLLGLYAAIAAAFVRYIGGERIDFWALWGWWAIVAFGLGLFTVGYRFTAWRMLAGIATAFAIVLALSIANVRTIDSVATNAAHTASRWYLWPYWYPLEIAISNSLRSPDLRLGIGMRH
jgi:hypothetical protein